MFLRTATSTLAVLALTVPAFGDVSPAEVWQNWIEYYQANGYNVTEGTREEAGDTLILRDVAITYAAPGDELDLRFVAPEISLLATGDGRVRTTLADTIPMSVRFTEDGEDVTLTGALTLRDSEIVTSGSAEDMTHDSRMGEVSLALQTMQTGATTRDLPVTLTIANLTSRQNVTRTDAMRFDVEMAAERLNLEADLADLGDAGTGDDGTGDDGSEGSEGPTRVKLSGVVNDLRGASTGVMPLDADPGTDMAAALRAGLDVSGNLAAGAGRFELDVAGTDAEGQPENVAGHYTVEGTDVSFGFGADGLKYQGAIDSTAAEFTVTGLPAPISYSMAETTFDVQMPVLKSDEPAPFKLAYSIGGLSLADGIWDMFDPQKVLPRDPASLDIDVTGLMRLTMDLFDPALAKAAEAAGDDAAGSDGMDATGDDAATPNPFEPTEISLNKIALSAVGASFDSSGELRVPESGDMTQPVGTLNARIEGVNGLIDRLVQLGVLNSDEVAGYRMMLAMFARPAPEGGDALVSEFEFREGGEIFANGQQVK